MGTKRAAIYCRVSKDKVGAGLGVERQEEDCRALAKSLGWDVVAVFPDNDVSASKGKRRKHYLAMLDAIRDGRVDAVLAWHTDRLHRSLAELEAYIAVCEPRSVATHCVKAGPLDLSTPSGRLIARQLGAVARYEVEHSSERIKAQKARASAAGQWTGGGRPFGYTRDGMALVEAEAEAIRDGVERVLAGESVYSITKAWQQGVPPVRGGTWHAQNVTRILTRPRNAGLAATHGEVVGRGAWPAILSEDDYRAVCSVLQDPARNSYSGARSLKWVGSGLYRCGRCGGDLRSATASNGDGTSRRTYRCRSGSHVHVNGEVVDEHVIAAVGAYLDDYRTRLLPQRDRAAAEQITVEANTLRARLDELVDMLSDGTLSRAEYERGKDRIHNKLAELTEARAAADSGSALDGIVTAETPSAEFEARPVSRQRAIIDAVVTVTVLPAKPGRLPGGLTFDDSRLVIERRALAE